MLKTPFFIFAAAAALFAPARAFEPGDHGIARGWHVKGEYESARVKNRIQYINLAGKPAKEKLVLSVDDGIPTAAGISAKLTLSREFKAVPYANYLLQLKVKSEGNLVVRCCGRQMAYSTPGKFQVICDLVRSPADGIVKVEIGLTGGTGPAVYELSDFELRPAAIDYTVSRRPNYGSTEVDAGCFIIYPGKHRGYVELAEKLQAAFDKKGIKIQLRQDDDVLEQDCPRFLKQYDEANLLLLGNLGVNRAFWRAYNRFLTAVDGYYPGQGGWVVQTAANVNGNGKNHLILGGSDLKGTGLAVDEFIRILEKTPVRDGKSVLPFLLKSHLTGPCAKAFDAAEMLWAENPAAAGPRMLEPGYGKVIRWYVNVMSYYWTGRASYKERSRKYLAEIIKDQADTHHYIIEFFVRAYDMVDNSDLFSDEERARIDSLIKKNFYELLTGPDLHWMTDFSRPYERIVVMNRHNIAPWMADVTMADFLEQNIKLSSDERKILDYRRSEKHEFLKYWVRSSFNVSLPRNLYGASEEEVIASMFRYALANEEYGLFTSGNARKALRLWEMPPQRPVAYDDQLIAGILANYYQDGHFAALYRKLPTVKNHFQMRYVSGVHRYTPVAELENLPLTVFCGWNFTEIQPQDKVLWQTLKSDKSRSPDFPAEEGGDVFSYCGGFETDSDYLQISGLGEDAGSITDFAAYGKSLLRRSASSTFGLGGKSYYDYNAACVQRLDRWSDDPKPYAGAARVSDRNDGMVFKLNPFGGCVWERSIMRLKRGTFLVCDRFSALEDGEYLIQIGWRPQGVPEFDGTTWTGVNGKVRFCLTSAGEKFQVVENLEAYREKSVPHPAYHHTAHVRLKQTESISAYTLLEILNDKQKPMRLTLGTGGRVKAGGSVFQFTGDGKLPRISNTEFTALPVPAEPMPLNRKLPMIPIMTAIASSPVMQLPGKINYASRHGEVIDFGKRYKISEIRSALPQRGPWGPGRLPVKLEYSTDGRNFTPISSKYHWHSGIISANYGQADPTANAYQYTRPDIEARFIRGKGAEQLIYYSADVPNRRSNLKISAAGDGFLVGPDIYPRYVRDRYSENYLYTLMNHDFKPVYSYRAPGVVQEGGMLKWPDEKQRLFVITDDAAIRILDQDGQVCRTIDLYKLHQRYNQQYGRQASRHPAGGFTLPFSLGVWRETPRSEPLLVVGRYGYYSFISPDGDLKGILSGSHYSINTIMEQNVDLDGDGKAELYGLGRNDLLKTTGPENQRILDPDGSYYFPQIFNNTLYRLPVGRDGPSGVEADKCLYFKPVGSGMLGVARQSFLAFFHVPGGKWSFVWIPTVELAAAAKIGEHEFLCATIDNLLWHLTFDPHFTKVTGFKTVSGLKEIRNIRNSNGRNLICTRTGVYQYREGSLSLLLAGDIRDAAVNNDGKLLALLENGELITAKEK